MEEIDHEAQVDAAEDVQDDNLDQDLPEDTTDWKAEAIKARRIASRYRNQAIKAKEAKKPEPTDAPSKDSTSKPTELGLVEKTFLRSEGIKSPEEMALFNEWKADHPSWELDQIIDNKRFQGELKDVRDAKVSQEAMPPAGKRGAPQAKDSVQYWIAKGELPPATPENVELRRQVVAAKRASSSGGGKFYNS